jgi:hypothetical protein
VVLTVWKAFSRDAAMSLTTSVKLSFSSVVERIDLAPAKRIA